MKLGYVVEMEKRPDPAIYFATANTITLGRFEELEPAIALLLVSCEGWHQGPLRPWACPSERTSMFDGDEAGRWARVREVLVPG